MGAMLCFAPVLPFLAVPDSLSFSVFFAPPAPEAFAEEHDALFGLVNIIRDNPEGFTEWHTSSTAELYNPPVSNKISNNLSKHVQICLHVIRLLIHRLNIIFNRLMCYTQIVGQRIFPVGRDRLIKNKVLPVCT